MKFLTRSILAIVTLVIFAPVFAMGEERPVSINYAGFGYDTSTEIIEDGMYINLTLANGKGTFGNSTIAITAEFVLTQEPIESCPDTHPVHGWIVQDNFWAVVITFASNSQIFGHFNQGWICLTPDLQYYVGESYGVFTDGSGKFEGASGQWVSHWKGVNLDPTTGFRSITGDINGFISLP